MKPANMFALIILLLAIVFAQLASPKMSAASEKEKTNASASNQNGRERLSFNDNWLFCHGDPPAIKTASLSYQMLKPWILKTGSEFSLPTSAAKKAVPAARAASATSAWATPVDFVRSDFNDSKWRKLALPHDWAVEGPFQLNFDSATGHLKYWGPVWYRKHFQLATKSDGGKKIYLEIDGAMSHAAVWLNGHLLGGWPYGYSSFALDLTPYLKINGENVIAIRLDTPPEASRWYPGGGIYRNVWLTKCAPLHVAHWGTFITTPQVSSERAKVAIKIDLMNEAQATAVCSIRTDIYPLTADGATGDKVASVTSVKQSINGGDRRSIEQPLEIHKPALWSIKSPQRYLAVTSVEQSGHLVDKYETPFGVRTIKFDPSQGFLLNGEHVKINGVCNHHDLGPLGAAVDVCALERQLEMLKGMGCNAIRTAHNPPAPELLDLCDRLGFVVMDESFDCWAEAKRKGDYHLLFSDWHEKDLRALIRRDRNHPCLVLWSIGNEIPEQSKEAGRQIARELVHIVHEEDPTRPATLACNDTEAGHNGLQKIVDVFGYNYRPTEYARFHKAHPDIALFGSETASCVTSRSDYFFPLTSKLSEAESDFQVSSYDLCSPEWATSPDAEFKGQDETGSVAGEFVWTGFDYLGEPTPFDADMKTMPAFTDAREKARFEKELKDCGKIVPPSRSSYFGIIDLAGYKKDRFYLYQARWRPELPMVHILPHWTWPERKGMVTPVHVYTSGDEAELFLNGHSLGRKKKDPFQYRLRWDDVIYEPGELRAVAYKNGNKWATDIVRTRGKAHIVTMEPDRYEISPKGDDLAFVTAYVDDDDHAIVPRTKNEVSFEVKGPAQIVATDNGDATDLTPFSSYKRKAFNGRCLVILRATGRGEIILHAASPGLRDSSLKIEAK